LVYWERRNVELVFAVKAKAIDEPITVVVAAITTTSIVRTR